MTLLPKPTYMKGFLLNRTRMIMTAFMIVLLCLTSWRVTAQTQSITGIVKSSDDNAGLPGVNILIEGTTAGTVTDGDGRYSIEASTGAVLVFTSIGYLTQRIVVASQSTIDLVLQLDVTSLEEVVVIGYGTVERRDLTTSVSSVGAKQLKDIPINSAAQALAGRLAGVQVTATEGSPNAQVKIRVRGGGSISQDNSPIYIVDGIQVENALDVISPQDIESIDVLKDASATAIYGARGANGIVVITTKGGRKQKTVVNFSSLIGVRQLANKLDVLKPYQFVNYQYERSRGSASTEGAYRDTYGTFEDMELYKQVPFTDWQDEVFGRSALMQTYNVGVTGGSKAIQFNVSATSNKEEGVMLGSDFDRKLINLRLDSKPSKFFNVGLNFRYNSTIVNGAGTSSESSSSVNRLRHSIKYRPFIYPGQTVETYDAEYAQETISNGLSLVNPVLLTAAEYKQEKNNVANINGYVSLNLTKYLTFKSTLGTDISKLKTYIFNDTVTSASTTNGKGLPIASIDTRTINTLNNSNVLSFSSNGLKSIFGERHKLDALIGQEIYQTKSVRDYDLNFYFPSGTTPKQAFNSMELGTAQLASLNREATSKLLSFFGRVNYAYSDKYFLSFSYRMDGSSKFSKGNRNGSFPGASFAWRASSEPFFERFLATVSDLKFRLSYGASGNNRIEDFLYLSVFETGSTNGFYSLNNEQVIGYTPSALANNNLTWETTVSRNLGMDAGFFNNKLQVSVDYYSNSSKDLLLERVVPPTAGYSTQIQNIGKTSNKGVEIQLSGTPIARGNFSWNTTFNISYNKSNVVSLGADMQSYVVSSGWAGSNQPADYIVKKGRSVGTIYGFVTDGFYTIDDFDYSDAGGYTLKAGVVSNQKLTSVNPQPGVIKFKDVTGDGEVTIDDRDIIGNATPKFFGGINNQFTYKNFDLGVFLNFQYGNDVLNANRLEFTSGYTINSNLLAEVEGRWRNVNAEGQVVRDPAALAELNKDAKMWSPLTSSSSFYVHSWAVEDASFLRVNNITLGYTLPTTVLSKVKISKLRLYATLNNVAVFTNYSGYDPEVDTRRASRVTPGVDYSAYPRSKGYIFGLNVTF